MEISPPTTILFEVYIDPYRCRNCGLCIDMCSMGVFADGDDGIRPARNHLCCSCFKCNEFCPENAINTRWIIRV